MTNLLKLAMLVDIMLSVLAVYMTVATDITAHGLTQAQYSFGCFGGFVFFLIIIGSFTVIPAMLIEDSGSKNS
jgi:hypothetical protein